MVGVLVHAQSFFEYGGMFVKAVMPTRRLMMYTLGLIKKCRGLRCGLRVAISAIETEPHLLIKHQPGSYFDSIDSVHAKFC